MFNKYQIKLFLERNNDLTPRSYDTEWKTRIHERNIEHQKSINEQILDWITMVCNMILYFNTVYKFLILILQNSNASITFCCEIICTFNI